MKDNLPYGFIKVVSETDELLRAAQTPDNIQTIKDCSKKYASGILKLSNKELLKMPKNIRAQISSLNLNDHIRQRKNGVYELRLQINKVKISVSSKDLQQIKVKFIEAVAVAFGKPREDKPDTKISLCDYMLQWLETVKKPAVKAISYRDYINSFNTYIIPHFKNKELVDIKGFELQAFFNGFTEQGKFRTAIKLYQLLAAVFDYAVMDDIISKSPLQKIAIPKYEQQHGSPLSRDEEKKLLQLLNENGNNFIQAYAFLMYTGLRRSELSSVTVKGEWITVKTSKQRKGLKEKTRNIPIPPNLKKVLPLINIENIKQLSPGTLTKHIKDIFNNHHTHDLRHTFITRCQECGIQRELVSLWAGHTADSSQTTLVYTHLEQNKQHQIDEMAKFDYTII